MDWPPGFYEAVQVIGCKGDSIRAKEVVVSIAVKSAAEALRVTEVNAGRTDGQTHPPIANISPNKGPGGKDQLQEESHNPIAS